jgi:hypothetical protein
LYKRELTFSCSTLSRSQDVDYPSQAEESVTTQFG